MKLLKPFKKCFLTCLPSNIRNNHHFSAPHLITSLSNNFQQQNSVTSLSIYSVSQLFFSVTQVTPVIKQDTNYTVNWSGVMPSNITQLALNRHEVFQQTNCFLHSLGNKVLRLAFKDHFISVLKGTCLQSYFIKNHWKVIFNW